MLLIAALLLQADAAGIQVLLQQNRLPEARTQLEAQLKQQPADPAWLNMLGILEERSGDWKASEAAFLKALKAAPGSVNIQLNLARLYQEYSDREPALSQKALPLYRRIVAAQPANTEARYQLAYLSMRQNDCATANAQIKLLPERQRAVPQALAISAACAAGSEQTAAIEKLSADPRLQPADVVGVLPALEQQKRYSDARKLLDAAVQRHGPSPALLTSLARVAYDQKDFERALGYLAHARDLAPKDGGVHFFYGMTAVALDLVLEAKNSLTEAVRLAPDNPYYRYALGAVLSEQRDAAAAVPHFERYCELRPDDPRGRFAIGVAYFQSNQLEEAARHFRPLTGEKGTAAGAHYFLGRIAKAEDRLDDAERELLLAIKMSAANLDAQAELGQVYVRQRKDAQAEAVLARVIAADSQHYLANLTLLGLYQRKRDPRADAQKQLVDNLQNRRKEKEMALWRTVEFRPY